ncbi:MAG: Maf family protein [Terriglobales bacterium]
MTSGPELVLASASPRRSELLLAAGFQFRVAPANVDERVLPDEPPAEYVLRLACAKAAAVAPAAGRDTVVLGADTIVVLAGEIIGKPCDDADAARILGRLSGRCHEVLTGVALRRGPDVRTALDRTLVWFDPLEPADIAAMVASGEPRDKAGAYAIQGLAGRFIPRIEGSYSNVIGLPLAVVSQLWRQILQPAPR